MSRRFAICALAALGIAAADATVALPEGWYTIRPGSPFRCKANYRADTATATLATHISGPTDIRWCEAMCNYAPSCVAFTFVRLVDPDTGRELNTCQLLASGNVKSEPFKGNRFEWAATCFRSFPLDKYDTIELELRADRYQQDGLRPGTPGHGVPGRYRY